MLISVRRSIWNPARSHGRSLSVFGVSMPAVSAVAVSIRAIGYDGAGGGALVWANNIEVVPGEKLRVTVGGLNNNFSSICEG